MSGYIQKYRIESARLKNWDYSTAWWYYVTINTKNHIQWFGKVNNKKMILSEIGKIVEQEWLNTPVVRNNVELDEFIVMPNHLHGIIILHKSKLSNSRDVLQNVSTKNEYFAELSPKSSTLSVIIRSFKGAVTRWCKKNGYSDFEWQARFYDRIIRNEIELNDIRYYIKQNPLNWEIENDLDEDLNKLLGG